MFLFTIGDYISSLVLTQVVIFSSLTDKSLLHFHELNVPVDWKLLIRCAGTRRICQPILTTFSILYIAAATWLQDWPMPAMHVQWQDLILANFSITIQYLWFISFISICIFIIFKGLAVVRDCLVPKSGPLNMFNIKQLSTERQFAWKSCIFVNVHEAKKT